MRFLTAEIVAVLVGVGMCPCLAVTSYESYSNIIESAFLPDSQTRTIRVAEVRRLMEFVRNLPIVQRNEIESNICRRILDFPLATNAHTTTWALVQKRTLFYDMADLNYWKTNYAAMLQLASHLGEHCTISTNFFESEFPKAYERDRLELGKALARYKRDGTWPKDYAYGGVGPHRRELWNRLQVAKIWNKDIRQYRSCLFGAFSQHISDYARIMSEEARKHFAEEFIRRGKLSPDEARQVFGSFPEKDIDASGGEATNATANVIIATP